MRARLASVRELAPRTAHFEFACDEWTGRFEPGQFVSLTQTIDGNKVTRAYSIASHPHASAAGGATLALCANCVEGGRFTPFLFSLRPGDEIEFTGPWGGFTLRKPPSDSVFVAVGTGIAPFRPMLAAAVAAYPATQFTLIFGARHRQGLLYDAEFRALSAAHPNFTYQPALTQPHAGWAGLTGRVQAHAIAAAGERRDIDVYLCGMREMVDDLRAQFKAMGFDRKRVVYERYD